MLNEGEIIREKIHNNFSIIPNEILNSNDLSLRAKGLLCWMLSKPDDWKFYKSNLHEGQVEGRDAINKAWAELVKAGYIQSKPVRVAGGKLSGYCHYVYSRRLTGKPSSGESNRITEKPLSGKPVTGNPQTGNPQLLNTNKLNTDKKEISNSIELEAATVVSDIIPGSGKEKAPPVAAPPPPENGQPANGSGSNLDDQAKGGQPPGKKSPSLYTEFIRIYDDWFKKNNDGFPPKIDGMGGKAAKSIMAYLRGVAKLQSGGLPITDEEKDEAVLGAWSYVLEHWNRIEPFYQMKTRLVDINSNFQNILTQIKNGSAKKRITNDTSAADVADAFANIDNHFAKRNAGTN